jgi:hypothetical protein
VSPLLDPARQPSRMCQLWAIPVSKRQYLVFCDQCYTCELLLTTSKDAAARAATGHANAYGHSTHIQEKK